jgi:excisionase family DNA binding protein
MTHIPVQRTPGEFLAEAFAAIDESRLVGAASQSPTTQPRGTTMTTTLISAPDAPAYITISDAADALALKPWPVVELIEQGELRCVRFGKLALVSSYDVEQLGGVVA